MKEILYLSYDGLTDPLGQSQILPYIKGLSKYGYRFTVISFEKKERYAKNRLLIEGLAQESGIRWVPLNFTVRPPLVSKFYDALRMRNKAAALHKRLRFSMVHCRSYIAADVGLYMKRRFGTKFFFDMRGFWADEKRDGGHWRDGHPVTGRVYRYYKQREKIYLQQADYVISLTEAGKKEILTWPFRNPQIPLRVIPCCADMQLFTLTDAEQKAAARERLGIAHDALVFSYLGSVGQWYMLPEMLRLFRHAKEANENSRFLFVTPTPPALIEAEAIQQGVTVGDLLIREVARADVPWTVKASDVNVSFIKPVYSKLSSSPTKLGEVLSMGIPVITNGGVGDVEPIVRSADAGHVVKGFDDDSLKAAVADIPRLLQRSPSAIRKAVAPVYDLAGGVEAYAASYAEAFSQRQPDSGPVVSPAVQIQ